LPIRNLSPPEKINSLIDADGLFDNILSPVFVRPDA
jgi:hypothetical protein